MVFQLITPQHHKQIGVILEKISTEEISVISKDLAALIEQVRSDIPEKKRISTGRYTIVKALGKELFPSIEKGFKCGAALFEHPGDPFVRSLALQILSSEAIENNSFDEVKTFFSTAAADEDWIVRECASGLVRKLVKEFPDQSKNWYLGLVKSADPNQRRFVSESLRPVVENRWFHKQPEYALGIIEYLFQESVPYPRTSVGNNLSDWMRVDQEIAWPIIQELVRDGDKNSYWIAYRACRNYIKKEPGKVMDLLKVKEYKYKNQIYRYDDH